MVRLEADVLQDVIRGSGILEADLVEHYLAIAWSRGDRPVLDRWLGIDDLFDTPSGHYGPGQDEEHDDQHHEAHDHLHGVGDVHYHVREQPDPRRYPDGGVDQQRPYPVDGQ